MYGITVLDTTVHPQPSCRSHLRTTLKLFHGSNKVQPDIRASPHLQGHYFQPISLSAERNQLPLIECVRHPECGSADHANPRFFVANALSDSFSVEWSSNEVTKGSYCLLQVRFLPAPSLEKCLNGISVNLSARTERLAFSDTPQALTSGFETCNAVIKLFNGEQAAIELLDDVEKVQHSIEELESLIKQATLNTTNLRKGQLVTQRSEFPSHMATIPVPDLSMPPHVFENEAIRRYQEIEGIQQKFAILQTLLSSMRPVTVFGQHVNGKVIRRVRREASRNNGGSKARCSSKTLAPKPPKSLAVSPSRAGILQVASTPIKNSSFPKAVTDLAARKEHSSSTMHNPHTKARPALQMTFGPQSPTAPNLQSTTPGTWQHDLDLVRSRDATLKQNASQQDIKEGKKLGRALLEGSH